MKCRLSQCATLVALGVLILCGPAQALTFTVSDITFTTLTGATEGFEWTLTPEASFQMNLVPGSGPYEFTYGQLSIESFPNSADSDDSFDVDFKLSPSDSAAAATGFGDIEATITGSKKLSVLFSNQNWIDVYFDVDGHYRVRYLGFNNAKYGDDTSFDLEAQIQYLSAPSGTGGRDDLTNGPAPVPEPSTMVLLGSGLLGLIYVGRSRRRK